MRLKETRVLLLWALVAICLNAVLAKRHKHRSKLASLGQRKDSIANRGGNFKRKYGSVDKLERRFETIRDLGSIVRCRLRNEETTLVAGNNLICGGKRYIITPEAAKDVEETATTRQSISFSPEGSPQGLLSTIQSGIYGKPIMSFLGRSQEFSHQSKLEPHEKYPAYGIYDKGLRSADPAVFTSQKPASVSFDQGGNSMYDMTDSQVNNFGSMELGDISHAVNSDDLKTGNQDSFYRNEQLQNEALQLSGKKSSTNNPFAQYWKSLKTNFYETTRSQLGDSDSNNGNEATPVEGQVRARIPRRGEEKVPIKKSEIQPGQKSDSSARKNIPKPAEALMAESNPKTKPGHDSKRYDIFGKPQQYPLGMFAGVPMGPWQFNNRGQMPVMRTFNGPSMMGQGEMPMPRFPNGLDRSAPQPGYTRSINSADEWGTRAGPRYFDPRVTGSPIRVPLNPIYAQMRSNDFMREPGLPARGRFQYGVQPGNGPPFMGYVSVPIMQRVPMGDAAVYHPGFPENGGGIGGELEAGQEDRGYSRGTMPFNYGSNGESEPGHGNMVPGLVRGTEQEVPRSNEQGGLPMDGGMGANGQAFGPSQQERLEREMLDDSASNEARTTSSQEDASEDYAKITGPENYVPAPFYRPPSYNPHETEDFFPDGTNQKFQRNENAYAQQIPFAGSPEPYKEAVGSSAGNAAEIYEDEKRQEEEKEVEEQEKKRTTARSATRIDVNGNKIEEDSDGKFVLTKEHVGFGPITVEAKTAKSAMKDPGEDDD